MSTQSGIRNLSDLFCALDECSFSVECTTKVLERVEFGVEELEGYLNFEIGSYTRNLLHSAPAYEVLAICWGVGHHTPIHDHQGQEGWIRVLQGEVVESLYKVSMQEQSGFEYEELEHRLVKLNEVSHVNDEEAFHSIRNSVPGKTVTLHVYSKPIPWCYIYNTNTGNRQKKVMKNFTEFGKRL